MATKLQMISELSEHTIKTISNKPDCWINFLKTAARNYKYQFHEQILIYAQKPEAMACADIDTWNNKLHRWVNKGAKGIALLVENGGHFSLRHIFDVSDTNGFYKNNVKLWEYKETYKDDVIQTLESTFGELESSNTIIEAVKSAAANATLDNKYDYIKELVYAKENSFLEVLDNFNIEVEFIELLENSIAYIILKRLGIESDIVFEPDDFTSIIDFNTLETISVLGNATSQIAEIGLRNISETIKEIEHNQSKQLIKNERDDYNDNQLQNRGRLSNTKLGSSDNHSNHREIRDASQDLPKTVKAEPIFITDDNGQTDTASFGNRPNGEGTHRIDSISNDKTDSIAQQGNKSDGVGASNEQHSPFGGGNSSYGTNIQLSVFPTVNEQMISIEKAEQEKSSAFSISQEDIDSVILNGSSFSEGKYRIYKHFSEMHTKDETIAFLKHEYGEGGGTHDFPDGTRGSHWHNSKGISLEKHGSYTNPDIVLKWDMVAKRIRELIDSEIYLNDKEKYNYSSYLEEKIAEEARGIIANEIRDIFRDYNSSQLNLDNNSQMLNLYDLLEYINVFHYGKSYRLSIGENMAKSMILNAFETVRKNAPVFTQRINVVIERLEPYITDNDINYTPPEIKYEYHLGDTVYIGSSKYELLFFDDNQVKLFDNNFPLINKELTREDFDRMVKENPYNNHLIATEKEHQTIVEKQYDLGFGHLGNGTTVWNRLEEENGDYKTVAHIDDNGDITYYEELPQSVKKQIESFSQTSDKSPSTEKALVIGTKLTINDRKFEIDSINTDFNSVSLRDITFQNGTGFPIFRKESIDFIKSIINEQENQLDTSIFEKAKTTSPVTKYDIHPEIPFNDRYNYKISNDELGFGGAKEKYRNNIEAIKLLKLIESENRFATTLEQDILAKYVGWGGIPEAFSQDNTSWTNEYLELKNLLDDSEYTAARESTLNAFYTSPIIIKAMYQALSNMGFKTGNILEPSCGIGNFLGLLHENIDTAKIYGIELDSITGRIAQQLYQKSSIAVQGFEKTNLPDSFFDVAIGNVPFGQYKLTDKRYDKNNFLVHDYFFAKTLDKVRPGGIIAFITSSGTMDKKNPAVRKYIAQRADLLGAIRLPNTAFKANANTEVTSDIIFLQKRDRMVDIEPDWVHLGKNENNITINQYFINNPEMILGEMVMQSTQFGMDSTCRPYDNAELSELLQEAISNIHAQITEYEFDDLSNDDVESIPADPNVKNFSYTVVDGDIYFRENSVMNKVEMSVTASNRVNGMIEIRGCVRALIEYQTEDYNEETIKDEQSRLNLLYGIFTQKYGLLNSRANNMAFSDDSSYCLLCSLEILDENGEFLKKADMFTKRTIKQHTVVTSVDTATEALAVSLGEKAKIDMPYMCELTGKTEQALYEELQGVIFLNPMHTNENDGFSKYVTADEYLSGNVREKLEWAKRSAHLYPEDYTINVEALTAVQPKDLSASEITVRLGATWIPPDIIKEYIFELLDTPWNRQFNIKVHYSMHTGEWNVQGKGEDRNNVKSNTTYGTDRINAYKIIEETLNLRDVQIFDKVVDSDGTEKRVLNRNATTAAQQKQETIKSAFVEWLWKDPDRREQLTRLYNDKFNNLRPREYDGSHLKFGGINPEISLRTHQVNAIAHILYGGNTLLAHCVGAGKTFEMIAAAMESKRLGLCHKSLFVVPNHLTEQWASEFLQLYPSANIMVATKKDFETKNRKKFCGRIATGDYDAVIIGHSQFEKIPMSIERQERLLQQQIDEIVDGIDELKRNRGERYSIKQLEKTKKSLQTRLDKLNDQSRKDDVVTFEELGIDRLFVDESHYYKNLFLYTKMRNVGGIAQTEAQKSSDLFMKCRYLDEITDGRGIIFATGTPISNSMVELYTMQRYLQYNTLVKHGLQHFDSWASTFGETVTAVELAPEGTGYRAKTRFAKFYNLPELMSMFKEVADIQTADMLSLPVPKANYYNISLEPTFIQKEMVGSLSGRADKVRNRMVESSVDNMLLITNDGRKLALEQRLMNDKLPDDRNSKVSKCADNVFEIWGKTKEKALTQLVFCDLSTPHYDGSFNVYDDIKNKLISKGVPNNEVAFIHDANSEVQKKEMFAKARKGQIRVLIGSTFKMGAGTNVQDKLIALHDLDCPWRPSDLEQRSGRIIRQGNQNAEVEIYRYVTKDTFDAYLFQLVENKQKFIAQVMTSKSPARSAEDIDETALSYAEIKALATGNPHIKEKMNLDMEVSKLKVLKSSHLSQKYALEDAILKHFPKEIKQIEERIECYKADIELLSHTFKPTEDMFSPMIIDGVAYNDKESAGKAIIESCKKMTSPEAITIGAYRCFKMDMSFDTFSKEYKLTMKNKLHHTISLGSDIFGNITRIENAFDGFENKLKANEELLENTNIQLKNAKIEVEKPFLQEEEMQRKSQRLDELNIMLNMDKRENEFVEAEAENEDNVSDSQENDENIVEQNSDIFNVNYCKLLELCPQVLCGEEYYLKMSASGFMDLTIEKISDDEISLAHYYEQNGDLMRDPEMTIRFDNENQTIEALTFLNDGMNIYQEVYDDENNDNPKLKKELNTFLAQWLYNIKSQGYEPKKQNQDMEGCKTNEDEMAM